MNSSKQYPFQRNRYYSGKLLTSADFQAEQDYFNNKSRFMNNMMYGSGVLCGLGVVALDDTSLLIESGVAIDGLGREIIQDTSLVRKLSAIEGYDSLTTKEACLCIKYSEEKVHSVYAINRENSGEFEYSRVSENSTLFLIDSDQFECSEDLQTEFLAENVLYTDANFEVKISIPRMVSKKHPVKLHMQVLKKTTENVKLTLHSVLQLPGFKCKNKEQELYLDFENLLLNEGEKYEHDYWLTVSDTDAEETLILLKSDSGRVYIDDELVEIPSGFEIKVITSDLLPREIVKREMGKVNLESRKMNNGNEYIRLANISLVIASRTAIIEKVEDLYAKKYIDVPGVGSLREDYLEYFVNKNRNDSDSTSSKGSGKDTASNQLYDNPNLPEVASGVLEIPLGEVARKGDIRYSGEIVHGLGKGNVFVDVGFEMISEKAGFEGKSEKLTIYGNADLFRDSKSEAPMIETAVKVLNSKGSFVVACKLLENVDFLIIKLRWVAVKFPSGNELGINDDYTGKSIVPETPTVVLNTRESYHFGVRFENMDACSLMYELTEDGSGEITPEGIYTAPSKEGVFEIRIYCLEMPVICAYAYAIVKKNGFDEPSDADILLDKLDSASLDEGTVLDEIPI